MCLVGAIGEELVIASKSHQLGARVLLLAEHKPVAVLVDVEAVFNNRCQLHIEGVVIDGLAARDINLQGLRFRTGEVANGHGAQPHGTHDLLQVGCQSCVLTDRFGHRDNVLLRLGPQRAVMLVGHRVQQRTDARGVVIQPEVSSGEHRRGLATALIEVCKDANHVARFLRVRGDEHLLFQQAKQMRCVGP